MAIARQTIVARDHGVAVVADGAVLAEFTFEAHFAANAEVVPAALI
jgi:hypothetical protein